ncbi:hypothetical protein [Streptomyces sp. NPDC048277]|uniref:hypothetical protein n=1 Tax=Streptomyces sp. NPDC048277 TaxID=3155027 RepID=UPI00340136D1
MRARQSAAADSQLTDSSRTSTATPVPAAASAVYLGTVFLALPALVIVLVGVV